MPAWVERLAKHVSSVGLRRSAASGLRRTEDSSAATIHSDRLSAAIAAWDQALTLSGIVKTNGLTTDELIDCYGREIDPDRITWVSALGPAPFVGYAPVPGEYASCIISQQRFRYERKLSFSRDPGLIRVFILGGSTAYGAGASSNQTTIAGNLESLLISRGRPSQVITCAAPSWCSTHEMIAAHNMIYPFSPDMIISLSGYNDAYWSCQGFDPGDFFAYFERHMLDLVDDSLARHERESSFRPSSEGWISPELMVRRLRNNVDAMATTASRNGSTFIYALQPTLHTTCKSLSKRELLALSRAKQNLSSFEQFFGHLRSHLALARSVDNVEFLDLTDVFDSKSERDEIFLDSCHFGDRGNMSIANAMADFIERTIDQR